MNANELADILKSTKFQIDEDGVNVGVSHKALDEAAEMLRQQQAEIDEYIKATDYWMKLCQEANANYTPQIKELSDEELLNQWHLKDGMDIEDGDLIDFARAILRKASEK